MARLLLSIDPGKGTDTELIEKTIMENRSTVAVNYGYRHEYGDQIELKGSLKELLKLQQAFEAQGQTCTLIDP